MRDERAGKEPKEGKGRKRNGLERKGNGTDGHGRAESA